MAFNRRKFWKFLYDNDDGNFHPLADVIGADYNESWNEEIKQMLGHLGSSGNHYMELKTKDDKYIEGYEIQQLGRDGKTLKDLDFKVRITADGRWYYLRAYLAQDFIEAQNELSLSVISTNKSVRRTNLFIVFTFGALLITAGLQYWSIKSTHEDAVAQRVQDSTLAKENKAILPTPVNVYLSDSTRNAVKMKKKSVP